MKPIMDSDRGSQWGGVGSSPPIGLRSTEEKREEEGRREEKMKKRKEGGGA
jgi:hypothetical protein